VRTTLADAVSRWTLSDVPIACSLSGGLDSSSIVGLLAQQGYAPETFSVGFTGAGEDEWNELPLARLVAQKWGTRHHEIVLGPETLLEDLLKMVWYLDEPYGGGLPSWLVFRQMSRSVKVGMTGTGGDELFGNYGKWRSIEGRLRWMRARREVGLREFEAEFFERYYYLRAIDKHRWLADPGESTAGLLYGYYSNAEAETIRDRVAWTDLATQLPEEFLMMTDRFSMAHSLEARTPFLDRELMDVVYAIPSGMRMARGDLKGLLREAVADLLPEALLVAGKRGFVIPLRIWLRDRLRAVVEQLLDPARLDKQGLLRPAFFHDVVRPHLEGRADRTTLVWGALMFQLWHLIFIEQGATDIPAFDLRALTE
jgi:asparagine synthase (glutamine-hydrolysing)